MFMWTSWVQILKDELLFEATGPENHGEVGETGRDGEHFDVQK